MSTTPDSTPADDQRDLGVLTSNTHGAFKPTLFLEKYETVFAHLRAKEISLLELGIYQGASLLMWRDYFERGHIAGLDLNEVAVEDFSGRISVYQGKQQDTELLDRIAKEVAPNGFDIIIDDASHVREYSRASFWHLFPNHLKSGGIYVIEDWGTGYWPSWADGREYRHHLGRLQWLPRLFRKRRFATHEHGMVGFIKELVDECGIGDATDPERGVPPWRPSTIDRMQVSHGQVFVVKR